MVKIIELGDTEMDTNKVIMVIGILGLITFIIITGIYVISTTIKYNTCVTTLMGDDSLKPSEVLTRCEKTGK